MGTHASQIYQLLPEEIEQVISDLQFQREGARVYYAVDPYDLFNFCFPITPDSGREINVDAIAEDQVALHEVFYARPETPILLTEYVREFINFYNYLSGHIVESYDTVEQLQRLVKESGLRSDDRDEADLERILQTNFHVILAVAMGVHSLGLERLKDLMRRRRLSIGYAEPDDQADAETIKDLFDGYAPTPLFESIFRELRFDAAMERQSVSNFIDARVVDRVLYLNKALDETFKAGGLRHRYVILYLSSAKKSKRIFSLPAVRDALPVLGGVKYNVLRTRRQLFCHAAQKSVAADPLDALRETVKNLLAVGGVLRQAHRLEASFFRSALSDCADCVFQTGGSPDCPLKEFCTSVREMYEGVGRRRMEIDNLGLLSKVEAYRHLLTAAPENLHQSYRELFAEVMRSGIKDVALEKMHQKLRMMQAQSEFAYLFKEGFSLAEERRALWSGKDSVIDLDQSLPLKPRLTQAKYKEVWGQIVTYYRDPTDFESLESAYHRFIELGPDADGHDLDSSVIRCFLYLVLGRGEGEERARVHLRETLADKRRLKLNPSLERECLYLLCWVARRTGRFAEADACARDGIGKWEDDARFFHGRCLNTLSWLSRNETSPGCPHTLRDAIRDAERAIDLYGKGGPADRDMVAANYHNLALLYAREAESVRPSHEERVGLLTLSRKFLRKVKRSTPKDSWSPGRPDYFFTEALVEYQEYLTGVDAGVDPSALLAKLERAKSEVEHALRLYENIPYYLELGALLESELARARVGLEGWRDKLRRKSNAPLKVFYSYSHKDAKLRAQLGEHLAVLRRQGLIEDWHDRLIDAGEDWAGKISEHLGEADIILILVTAAFFDSDYCYDIEMKEAIDRHEKGNACVVPIILRPCLWEGAPFRGLQALPSNVKPVSTWKDRAEAFLDVTRGIKRVADGLRERMRAEAFPPA